MRCKCCDIVMFDHKRINPLSKLDEDLCTNCLHIAQNDIYIKTKEYQFEHAYEGLTRVPVEHYDME